MNVGKTAAGNLNLFYLEVYVFVHFAALAVEARPG
jgi:hypothetical protein